MSALPPGRRPSFSEDVKAARGAVSAMHGGDVNVNCYEVVTMPFKPTKSQRNAGRVATKGEAVLIFEAPTVRQAVSILAVSQGYDAYPYNTPTEATELARKKELKWFYGKMRKPFPLNNGTIAGTPGFKLDKRFIFAWKLGRKNQVTRLEADWNLRNSEAYRPYGSPITPEERVLQEAELQEADEEEEPETGPCFHCGAPGKKCSDCYEGDDFFCDYHLCYGKNMDMCKACWRMNVEAGNISDDEGEAPEEEEEAAEEEAAPQPKCNTQ